MSPNRRGKQTRSSNRMIAIAVTVVSLLVVSGVLLVFQNASSQADVSNPAGYGSGQQGVTDAPKSGDIDTVTEVDKKFLEAVRLAGLWEIPAGHLAQEKAGSQAVKRAGFHLIDGHSELDQMVREDAKILGVDIPDEATEEQKGWVQEMKDAPAGKEFDKVFVRLTRASHGKIFATIGEVRGSTQNDLIRRHARKVNQTVLKHLEVIEDSGLVEPETLEEVEEAVAPRK